MSSRRLTSGYPSRWARPGRGAWVEEGVDVLVCHARLVQTGLDLVEFPTICWYETESPVSQSTPNAALLVGRAPANVASRPGVEW